MIGNDEEALRDILRAFLTDYPEQMGRLKKSIEENDAAAAAKAAHALKGAIGNFNIIEAYSLAVEIEAAAKEGKEASCLLQKTKELEAEISLFCKWINDSYGV